MSATTLTEEQIKAAYEKWVKALNLTDDQKQQFHAALDKAAAKLNDMAAKGEQVDPERAKATIRAAVEKWLTPEQLVIWDQGMAKAKSYLG